MHTVARPLTPQQLIDAVHRHIELIHNGVRDELLESRSSDGPIRLRIARLTAGQMADAMDRFDRLHLDRDLEVLRDVHATSASSSKARFVAEIVCAVHGIMHTDDDADGECVLCDLIFPGLILTLLTKHLGLDQYDRCARAEPPPRIYCKVRKPRALAKLISNAWEGADEVVESVRDDGPADTEHDALSNDRSSARGRRITISGWMMTPRLQEAIEWFCNEASRLVETGRSAARADELTLRRLRRRLRRQAHQSDEMHPWLDWIKEHRVAGCIRTSLDAARKRHPCLHHRDWYELASRSIPVSWCVVAEPLVHDARSQGVPRRYAPRLPRSTSSPANAAIGPSTMGPLARCERFVA